MFSDLPQFLFLSRTTQTTKCQEGIYREGQSSDMKIKYESGPQQTLVRYRLVPLCSPANLREWGLFLNFFFFYFNIWGTLHDILHAEFFSHVWQSLTQWVLCSKYWTRVDWGSVYDGPWSFLQHLLCCFPAALLLPKPLHLQQTAPKHVQELTGYWKGVCVTLNTATVLRNSNRIMSALLDVS